MCAFNYGVSSLAPVQTLGPGLGLPAPATITAPLFPPPAGS
jgi:hypothetical protein